MQMPRISILRRKRRNVDSRLMVRPAEDNELQWTARRGGAWRLDQPLDCTSAEKSSGTGEPLLTAGKLIRTAASRAIVT